MVRKLALAVSLALGTLGGTAHALGLGELSSQSALNQNFRGDIRLLSLQADTLDSVRVRLADAALFERAGMERPFYLSQLKFEPRLDGSGNPVIAVSSDFPIREPFMNFLVEVNWPNGRLVREYTVLLDPPTTMAQRPPAVTPASRQSVPPRPSAPPAPGNTSAASSPAAQHGLAEYGPVKANETAWGLAQRLRPSEVSMEQMMMALLRANSHAFVDGDINRLRRGQILRVPDLQEIQQLSRQAAAQAYREQQAAWLARRDARLRQASVSEAAEQSDTAQQTADAAQTAESGDQLRIATVQVEVAGDAGASDEDAASPAVSDLRTRLLAARENAETSRQESEVLRSRVDDLSARLADMQRLLTLKDEQLARLQDRVATQQGAEASTTEAEVVTGLSASPEAPASEVLAEPPAEISDSPVVEEAGVADPVAEGVPVGSLPLDQELTDSVQTADPATDLLDLRIDQASLGDVAAGSVAEIETHTPFLDSPIEDIAPQVDPDRIVMLANADVPPDEATGGTQTQSAAPGSSVQQAEPLTTPTVAEQPVPVEQAAEQAVPPATSVVASTGQGTDGVLSPQLAAVVEKNIVPIALGGMGLLGLLGWLSTRRRREVEPAPAGMAPSTAPDILEETGAAPLNRATEPLGLQDTADIAEISTQPESSFLEEFSPSDINALQDETGDVDPVSEADVYIAYGRYQQAEELLLQAMDREPDRLALRHKLLEVHYATRKTAAFAVLAQEMVDAGQDVADEDAWMRAQDMGRELDPDNPLFRLESDTRSTALGSSAFAASASTFGSVDADTLSVEDSELSMLAAAYDGDDSRVALEDLPPDVSISLDIGDSTVLTHSADSTTGESIPLEELESFDFGLASAQRRDLDGLRFDGDTGATEETLDIDSMLAETDAAMEEVDSLLNLDSEFSPDDLQAQLDELSDLSMLSDDLPKAQTPARDTAGGDLGLVAEDAAPVGLEPLDAPHSLQEGFDALEVGGPAEDTGFETDVPAVTVGSEAEVATKLDLARAYLEMGDEDGARSILQEVLVEGSDAQRDDAQQLLGSLG